MRTDFLRNGQVRRRCARRAGFLHLGGKRVDLYHLGRAHTNGDVVAYFPAARTLARAISSRLAMRAPI